MSCTHPLLNESRSLRQFCDGAGVVILTGIECHFSGIQGVQVGNRGGFIGGYSHVRLPAPAGRQKLREHKEESCQDQVFGSHLLFLAGLPTLATNTRTRRGWGTHEIKSA